MASVSRPSCGPTIETPQQPRSFLSQNGHFDAIYESASSSLKIHAKKIFRASRGQISASRLCQHAQRLRAPPSAVRYDSGPYHFFYAAAAPVSVDDFSAMVKVKVASWEDIQFAGMLKKFFS